MIVLAEFNKNPIDLRIAKEFFLKVFDKWFDITSCAYFAVNFFGTPDISSLFESNE